jgi:hypothetical protein
MVEFPKDGRASKDRSFRRRFQKVEFQKRLKFQKVIF